MKFGKVALVPNHGDPGEIKPDPIEGEAKLQGVDEDGRPVWDGGVRNPSQLDQSSAEDGPPSRLEFEALRMQVREQESQIASLTNLYSLLVQRIDVYGFGK